MGPSQIRALTPVSCIGGQILDHWATREALILYLLANLILPSLSHQWPPRASTVFHPCMSTDYSSFHLCAYGETLLSLQSNLWPFPWSRRMKRQRRWNCGGSSKPLERKNFSYFDLPGTRRRPGSMLCWQLSVVWASRDSHHLSPQSIFSCSCWCSCSVSIAKNKIKIVPRALPAAPAHLQIFRILGLTHFPYSKEEKLAFCCLQRQIQCKVQSIFCLWSQRYWLFSWPSNNFKENEWKFYEKSLK